VKHRTASRKPPWLTPLRGTRPSAARQS
jgi:hypothetical protein